MSARAIVSEKLSVAFRINWTILLLGLVFLAILLRLGYWQLERAQEKHELLTYIAQQQSLPALDLDSLDPDSHVLINGSQPQLGGADVLRYRQVTLSGQFDAQRYWLLDNQVQQGVVGYHVIGLFVTQRGWQVLVNRGWVPAPLYREQLPPVSFPAGTQQLSGRLVQPSDNPLIVAAAPSNQAAASWPLRIQEISLTDAEQTLGQSLFAAMVQLAADDPAALTMEWRDINVGVSKHHGYAVQWFAMAAALVVALICANTNLAKMFSGAPAVQQHNTTDQRRADQTDNNNNATDSGGRS